MEFYTLRPSIITRNATTKSYMRNLKSWFEYVYDGNSYRIWTFEW